MCSQFRFTDVFIPPKINKSGSAKLAACLPAIGSAKVPTETPSRPVGDQVQKASAPVHDIKEPEPDLLGWEDSSFTAPGKPYVPVP